MKSVQLDLHKEFLSFMRWTGKRLWMMSVAVVAGVAVTTKILVEDWKGRDNWE